jgi:hypothetical protein
MQRTDTVKATPCPPGAAEHLRRVRAAHYIRDRYDIPCEPATLAKYACVGGGPPFFKAGRIPIYPRTGLDEWARTRLGALVRSTSETRKPAPVEATAA